MVDNASPEESRRRAQHRRAPDRRILALRSALAFVAVAVVGLAAAAGAGVFSPTASVHPPPTTTTLGLPSTPPSSSAVTTTSLIPAVKRPTTTTAPPPSSRPATTSSSTSTSTTTSTTTTTIPTLDPSQVLVEVLNGTGATDQATSAANALHKVGFLINGTGDAASFQHATTLVAYPPGDEEEAATVAAHIIGATALQSDPSLPAGVVDLVLGGTYYGVRP